MKKILLLTLLMIGSQLTAEDHNLGDKYNKERDMIRELYCKSYCQNHRGYIGYKTQKTTQPVSTLTTAFPKGALGLGPAVMPVKHGRAGTTAEQSSSESFIEEMPGTYQGDLICSCNQ